jgi:hypothetical protein
MSALCQERTSVATRSLRQRGREMIDLLAVEEPKPKPTDVGHASK